MRKLTLVPVAARVHFKSAEGAAVPDWPTVRNAKYATTAETSSTPAGTVQATRGRSRIEARG